MMQELSFLFGEKKAFSIHSGLLREILENSFEYHSIDGFEKTS